jgi:hypothetical protein
METKCIHLMRADSKVRESVFVHGKKALMTQLFQTYGKFVTLIIHASLSYGSCRDPSF